MITDIPTPSEFEASASRFFNIAWDLIIAHVGQFSEYESEVDIDDETHAAYWKAASGDILVALSLVQNGIDHLLKARIAAVSPFILISSPPRDWPRGSDKHDVPFSEFRTLDSQDLIKVHDTVGTQRLPEAVRVLHEHLRRLRNAVFHTVDRRLSPIAADVAIGILYATHALIGSAAWLALRKNSLRASPTFALQSDGLSSILHREFRLATELLGAKESLLYLGIDKKRRFYSCPTCIDDYFEIEHDAQIFQPGIAQLTTKDPNESRLRCTICGLETQVLRKRCKQVGCKGNVLDPKDRRCLTCNKRPGDSPDI